PWRSLLLAVLALLLAADPADAAKEKKKERSKPAAEKKAARKKAKPKAEPKAEAPAEEKAAATLPPAELTVGVQFRDDEAEGLGDVLVPAWRFPSGLLFVNPRSTRTDQDAEEYSLGLGYRHLFPKREIILGANGYYDYRDTGHSTYDQWGAGLELLSRWLDARANYYDPEDTRTVVAETTERSSSSSTSTEEGWTDPYAEDHEIAQSYIIQQTTRTTTTTRFFEQYEQAMDGWDAEAGLRLPLPVRPETFEARVFGGYYRFDADYGDDIEGFKARLELRLLASLFLDAAWYEDDALTGSDYYAGGRFSVPLDLAALAHGRNPFAAFQSRLGRGERTFDARLTEMVMRDPQIRLEVSDFIERADLYTVQTSKDTDTWRQDYTLMADVNFVDGDAGSRGGDGSAERPFSAIQDGVDDAFGERNVYVYDASKSYRENVEMTPGVTLWGSGCLVPGYNGKSFGSGIQPTVDGRSGGPSITMADRTTIRGFRITNTDHGGARFEDVAMLGDMDISRVGLFGNGATDLRVECNTIEGAAVGSAFGRVGDFNLVFANNDVLDNVNAGMLVGGEGASGTFDVLVDGSRFENNGIGLMSQAANYDSALLQIQDSAFNRNNADGATVLMIGNGLASVVLAGSQAERNAGAGFNVTAIASDLALVELSGVGAHRNGGGGVNIALMDSGSAQALLHDVQAHRNEGLGVNIGVLGADEGLISLSHVSADDNAGPGVTAVMVDAGEATAWLNHVHADGNEGPGLNVSIAGAGSAVAGVANSSADGNLGGGVNITLSDAPWAMALVSGSEARGNLGGPGFNVLVENADLALANLSGLTANDNEGGGILLNMQSPFAAIGVIGMPAALVETLEGALGLAGGLLPPEVEDLLGPAGPIEAVGNQGQGVAAFIDGDLIAGGAFFDIRAEGNLGGGVSALVSSSNGIAVGLGGSSENIMEIAQLGADIASLFGIDLAVAPSPGGRTVVNGNLGPGFVLGAMGNLAGVGALVGVEADGNLGLGAGVMVSSEAISVAAAARILALNTMGDGLVVAADGPTAAIGVVADAQATGNAGNGIVAEITSDEGYAGALFASTDPLRPVAALLGDLLLGEPLAVPGQPFGPVIASDNGADGVAAVVTGRDGALGLFLDTQATGNGDDGLDVSVNSPEGYAISAFVSSDWLFDLLGGFLGPIDYDPLGGIIASGNVDHGIRLRQDGLAGAYAVLVGLQANENGKDGLNARLDSGEGDAMTAVIAADAMDNGGQGFLTENNASLDSLAAFVDVWASGNERQGIRAIGTSVNANAYAILAGVDTVDNGMAGSSIELGATVDAVACLTDMSSYLNEGRGAAVTLTAGGSAVLLAGSGALDDFTAAYDPLFGLFGLVAFLLPQDAVLLDNNEGAGLYADLHSAAGEAVVNLADVRAVGNDNAGLNLDLAADSGGISAGFLDVTAGENGGRGLDLFAAGAGSLLAVDLTRVSVNNNSNDGARIRVDYNGPVNVYGEQVVAIDNGGAGVRMDILAGGLLNMDFGGGALGSPGQGQFFGNGARDFRNVGAGTVFAEQNWWGANPPLANQFFGSVDYTPWLTEPPP
ncbi:MAG: inverse autotransporter beta domain-containing protein, partial [Kiritimatiellae bacterium]|nr:inverse autotransporter beta domain-containing protein [Kiritimatiellia bacterium]